MDKKTLFKGSSSVLGLGSIGKLFNVGVKVVLARLLGPIGLGIYELVLSITRLGSMIPQMGLHQTVVYYVARFYARRKEVLAIYAIRVGLFVVLLFSLILGLSIWGFEEKFITAFFSERPETWAVMAIVLLVPLFSLKNYTAFCYRAMKQASVEVMLNRVCFPLFMLVGVGILYIVGIQIHIELFLKVIVVAAVIPVLWAVVNLGKKIFIPFNWMREKVISRQMLTYSMPIWLNAMMTVGIAQIDRIFIGAFSTTEQLGYYGAAYTFAYMLSFIMGSFTPVSQPLMSEAYSNRDFDYLQKIYRTIVDWTAYLIIPLVGGFFLFGKAMLGLIFGEEFRVAYWILCILGVGQAINALSGPAGNILLMTNRQKISVYSLGAGLIVGIILNIILIPLYGALGAAIGTALSIMLINLIRVYQIKVHLNVTHAYHNLFKTILIVLFSVIVTYIVGQYTVYLAVEILCYAVLLLAAYLKIFGFHKMNFEL